VPTIGRVIPRLSRNLVFFVCAVAIAAGTGTAGAQALLPEVSAPDASVAAGGDTQAAASEEFLPNPFGLKLPAKVDPHNFSQAKHCDVLRHLKVPVTTRRLDAYMRPEFILPRGDDSVANRDQVVSFAGRQKLYDKGIDLYGCSSLNYLHDIKSNLSDNPVIAGTGPWHD